MLQVVLEAIGAQYKDMEMLEMVDSMNDILEANDYHNLGLIHRSLRRAIDSTEYTM